MDKDTTNLRRSIEEGLNGEEILGAVIGRDYKYIYNAKDDPTPADKMGVILTWDQAVPILDYEYYAGFGGADCHPVFVWTKTRVLFIHEYDGATSVSCVPRNPQDCWPQFSGGYTKDEI